MNPQVSKEGSSQGVAAVFLTAPPGWLTQLRRGAGLILIGVFANFLEEKVGDLLPAAQAFFGWLPALLVSAGTFHLTEPKKSRPWLELGTRRWARVLSALSIVAWAALIGSAYVDVAPGLARPALDVVFCVCFGGQLLFTSECLSWLCKQMPQERLAGLTRVAFSGLGGLVLLLALTLVAGLAGRLGGLEAPSSVASGSGVLEYLRPCLEPALVTSLGVLVLAWKVLWLLASYVLARFLALTRDLAAPKEAMDSL